MRILVADDEPVSRRLLEAALKRWDYEVDVVCDGDSAWQALQEPDAPRLAILDWMMPGMDGIEVCRKVREREDAHYTYIILLTSKSSREDIIEGLDSGVDDFLTKPFDSSELQAHLRVGRRILDLEGRLLTSLKEVNSARAALDSARKREGDVGARIQQALLLGKPPTDLGDYEISVLSLPSAQIDGDFYDFYHHDGQCLDIIVGDVMGKGVTAALLGAAMKNQFLRALFHLSSSMGPGELPEAADIVAQVHRQVVKQFMRLEQFITLCYARIHLRTCKLELVDCGHTMTIHYRSSTGTPEGIKGDNMAIGFSEHDEFRAVTRALEPGDLLFFYSDGLTEAQSPSGEQFGIARLIQLIEQWGRQHPHEVIERARAAVVSHAGSATFKDDLTCVAIKVGGAAPLAKAQIVVTSDLHELFQIRGFVRSFCQDRSDLGTNATNQLALAASEVAANIIRHAYRGRTGMPIEAQIEAYRGRVSMRFIHEGESFDPETAQPPPFDGSREGGFGLYFISQNVDEVRYGQQDEDGRVGVYLVKYRMADDGRTGDGDIA